MPKKLYVVTLKKEERQRLNRIVSQGKGAARRINHARILLQSDTSPQGPGWKDAKIAEALNLSQRTVERVRKQYVEHGMEASLNRKQHTKYRPRKLEGEAEAYLIATACSEPPEGRSRWTLELLAKKMVKLKLVEEISLETVRQRLKKTS